VDLGRVIESAVETVKPAAEAKEIKIHKVIDPIIGPVMGDPNRLQQVIWNLLSNAVKFTPKGGSVQIHLGRVNSHLEVVVSDTGQGIKPDFLPYVFDRFRQEDSSSSRRHSGLGLGLAIVRHLVELHGGSVRVKSPGEGQGATFFVVLPRSAVHDDRAGEERAHPAASSGLPELTMPSLAGVSVLVVDDEPDARELLRRVLGACGATVTLAGSVKEALALVKELRPTVIVSDIGMPDEDGYLLIQRVRALGPAEGGLTPALALTAFARAEDRRRVLLAGFQMHLAKPAEASELTASVANLAGLMFKR
jgi:CheY-like chemotaxis protein